VVKCTHRHHVIVQLTQCVNGSELLDGGRGEGLRGYTPLRHDTHTACCKSLTRFGGGGKPTHLWKFQRWGIYITYVGHAASCTATRYAVANARACEPRGAQFDARCDWVPVNARAPARLRLSRYRYLNVKYFSSVLPPNLH
jgi:hypothetical protein